MDEENYFSDIAETISDNKVYKNILFRWFF